MYFESRTKNLSKSEKLRKFEEYNFFLQFGTEISKKLNKFRKFENYVENYKYKVE